MADTPEFLWIMTILAIAVWVIVRWRKSQNKHRRRR